MGIELVVISNDFSFSRESISKKIHNIMLVAYFFSVSENADMSGTSFHFEKLFSTQPINLVVEEISRNKSNHLFYKSKRKMRVYPT